MPQNSYLLTIKALIKETQETTTLVFEPSPHLLHYQAGQFITLIIPIGTEKLHRSYSLCTSPHTDPLPAITIKRIPGGKVSNYLNKEVKVGDKLEALPVTGNFILPQDLTQPYKGIFIAGGSGITPIFSMIKALLYKNKHNQALLIYANRNEEHIIYNKSLQKLETKHPSRMQITHILSQPSVQWKGLSGRLNTSILKNLIDKNIHQAHTHYFLCGPEGLMKAAYTTLVENGVSTTAIYKEKFTNAQKEQTTTSIPATLTIHYQGEKHKCTIGPKQTLLDVALANGIDIPFSCGSGICNSCRAKCIQGEVNMLEDEGLDQEELNQGYVLTCVGYATTDEVVIEVD